MTSWKAQVAGQNLKVDLLIGEVFRTFRRRDIAALLLKGPSIARWLYDGPTSRVYNDCDVLVPPREYGHATAILKELGFERRTGSLGTDDRPIHAENWVRARDGAIVDLHRHLIGVGVEPHAAFDALAASAETMDVRGEVIPVLDPPRRVFQLVLHAAQHGREMKKVLEDLRLSVALPARIWEDARATAENLEAIDAFAAGLRVLPEGAEVADRLQLPEPATVEARLRAATAPDLSLGFEWLSRESGLGAKARFILKKAFPPAAHLRMLTGRPDARWLGLLSLYVRRFFWMLVRVPAGLKAWLSARNHPNG